MRLRLPSGWTSGQRQNLRILATAVCISLICGAIHLLEPLELVAEAGYFRLRSHAPDNDIVIVAVDNRTTNQLGSLPWPGPTMGMLVDRLQQARARSIAIDLMSWIPRDAGGQAQLQKAIQAADGKVILPAAPAYVIGNDDRGSIPPARFTRFARVAANRILLKWNGMSYGSHYSEIVDNRIVPTFPSIIAGRPGKIGERFAIDYAPRSEMQPKVSASRIISGQWNPASVAGKDVLIGETTLDGPHGGIPRLGQYPKVFIHAAAAETLRHGRPTDIGWLPGTLVALAGMLLYLQERRRIIGRLAFGVTTAVTLAAPVFLQNFQIASEVMPALALIATVSISRLVQKIKHLFRARGTINPVSGLPNLNALRETSETHPPTVAVARVLNFAEVATSLAADREKELVEQMVSRLAIGTAGRTIYQADDGLFIWLAESGDDEIIGEQLSALHALFRSPVIVGDRLIDVTVSFGLDTDRTRPLLQRVSGALVAADRAAGEGRRWMTYDPAELQDAEWKMSLLGRLDQAIDQGEIWVAYQPRVELGTGRIAGAEALARWSHPEKGEIPPSQFIPAAERSGRIERLTAYILDRALADAAALHAEGHLDFGVSVNLSARLLDMPDLGTQVREALLRHRMAAHHLTLEITETTAVAGLDGSFDVLRELSASGVRLSIDDYGTGFSTLDYLKRIPADEIKIDRSFVAMLERSQSDRIMVHSTIQLAHSLGRRAVAEGVETASVLNELRLMGCDDVQGYLTGRPMKLDALRDNLPRNGAIIAA